MADRIGVFRNCCYFCNAVHGIAYIFVDESVIAFFPCIEIWKISLGQGEQSHSSPCIRILIGILYAF